MLSADAFSAFEEAGLEDEQQVKQTGARFRDTVLALGGGRAPADVFKVSSYEGLLYALTGVVPHEGGALRAWFLQCRRCLS